MLRRVADEGVFVASTGGGDFTLPTAMATKVDGGWEVSGRKSFVSGAPVATLASTWACTDEGGAIGFGIPLAAPGVEIVENWDTPGMRGTASHDVVFDRVLVRDAQVTAQRTPGEFAPVLAILAAKALMVVAATYLGIAHGARDEVVARVRESGKDTDVGLQRTIGAMDEQLLAAESVLRITLLDLGDDPEPSVDTFVTAMLAKRTIIESARTIGDLAMDALGGRAYRRGDPVERAWRDLPRRAVPSARARARAACRRPARVGRSHHAALTSAARGGRCVLRPLAFGAWRFVSARGSTFTRRATTRTVRWYSVGSISRANVGSSATAMPM